MEEAPFYHSNITTQSQIRYIEYKWELETLLPVCGLGYVEDPGICEEDSSTNPDNPDSIPSDSDASASENGFEDQESKQSSSGCNASAIHSSDLLLGIWLMGPGLLFLRQRKKKR